MNYCRISPIFPLSRYSGGGLGWGLGGGEFPPINPHPQPSPGVPGEGEDAIRRTVIDAPVLSGAFGVGNRQAANRE
jgi:hypothetical protein